jgi:hypothetical protein
MASIPAEKSSIQTVPAMFENCRVFLPAPYPASTITLTGPAPIIWRMT